MKTKKTIFLGILATFILGACQSDDESTPLIQGENTNVKFELDASSLHHNPVTRAYSPVYTRDGFSIYAFKKVEGSDDYVYSKTIDLTNMAYSELTQKLTGTDNLAIGTYKFLTAYGIANQSSRITVPAWTNTSLTDNLSINYNGTSAMSEIFLQTGSDIASLTPYDLGLTDMANQTVSATLKRAVGRVDLQFVSADKVGDDFIEKPYTGPGGNILGGKTLEQVQLRFTDANNAMTLFGLNTTAQRSPQTFNLSDFSNTVVVGDGMETEVGKSTFTAYNNIQPSNIISGGAHIYGSYLFPNDDASKTASLQLYIKPVGSEGRIITISTNDDTKLPLERNKVTIVKVYVLNNNNVFSTTVDFEVEIDTVWEEAHEVNGNIS